MIQSRLEVKVGDKTLQLTDLDMFTRFIQDTMTLTLSLMGANTTADGGKITLMAYNLDRTTEITFSQSGDPIRNLIIDRATFTALRHLAVKTSLSLLDSLRHRKILIYLVKIFHNYYSCTCKISNICAGVTTYGL